MMPRKYRAGRKEEIWEDGVVKITLKKDYVVIVDEEDYELVSQYTWHVAHVGAATYARNSAPRGTKKVFMHRLIMEHRLGRSIKGENIDHRDREGLNNRFSNIRLATYSQNNHNKKKHVGTSSVYRGVCWEWRGGNTKWKASIRIDGRLKHLGRFIEEEQAARAYDTAAQKQFGEFAQLNFPTNEENQA